MKRHEGKPARRSSAKAYSGTRKGYRTLNSESFVGEEAKLDFPSAHGVPVPTSRKIDRKPRGTSRDVGASPTISTEARVTASRRRTPPPPWRKVRNAGEKAAPRFVKPFSPISTKEPPKGTDAWRKVEGGQTSSGPTDGAAGRKATASSVIRITQAVFRRPTLTSSIRTVPEASRRARRRRDVGGRPPTFPRRVQPTTSRLPKRTRTCGSGWTIPGNARKEKSTSSVPLGDGIVWYERILPGNRGRIRGSTSRRRRPDCQASLLPRWLCGSRPGLSPPVPRRRDSSSRAWSGKCDGRRSP